MKLIEPVTAQQRDAYFDFRWRLLRQPWNQPRGSEKDQLEDQAIHRAIINQQQQVIAAGRLHMVDQNTAQIRYMAVEPAYQKQGYAKQILESLEQVALVKACDDIILHARQNAVGFYRHHGYLEIEASHTLYDVIPHTLMKKCLHHD